MNFDEAFDKLINHEGGYVNNPRDPGGETKYGISKRQYPQEDIKNLTLTRAKAIYAKDYWAGVGCDLVPEGLKFDLFDTAVNSGPGRAVKLLQQTVGQAQDGVLGPLTLQALKTAPSSVFAARFNGSRLLFMTQLHNWDDAGRGWAVRIATNLLMTA